MVIIWFRVQFGINLHKRVLQKAEIAQATSVSVISFLKNSCQFIPNLLIKDFSYTNLFPTFHTIFIILHDIIRLEKFILSFSQS